MRPVPFLVAACLLFTAAPAFAQDPAQPPKKGWFEQRFEKMDTDSNGAISAEESEKAAAERFAQMDVDGDARITAEDIDTRKAKIASERPDIPADKLDARNRQIKEHFRAMDTDGDKAVSREEYMAHSRAAHKARDKDENGEVSLREAKEWVDAQKNAGPAPE